LELAVLAKDKESATRSTSSALALLREPWEAETTIRNLRLIHEARERRQDVVEWTKQIEEALEKRSKSK
ncbi:MAG TPA: TRAFs-binding domain-containing protein, partial [Nitrososphaeraceae archaeon]|nr:TRAFs-binding domain-containing protein [Nitrososphaeraceae archaeon]